MINLDQFFTQSQIAFALLIIAAALAYLAFGRKVPNKKRKQGNILVVLLITTVTILSLVAAGYLFWQNRQLQNQLVKTPSPIQNSTPANNFPVPTPVSTPVVDTKASWKKFVDNDYKISFSYPKEWIASVTKLTPADELKLAPWILSSETIINFNNSNLETGIKEIYVTKTVDYNDGKHDYALENIKKLNRIFETEKPLKDDVFELPSQNAGIIGNTFPNFVKNFDGSWKGFYYFAKIAQNCVDCQSNSSFGRLFDLLIILTDGKGNIFQIWASVPINNSTYEPLMEKCNDLEKKQACVIAKNLKSDFETIYLKIVESLKTI